MSRPLEESAVLWPDRPDDEGPASRDEIWLPSRGALHRVRIADIRHVEADADYIRLFTAERSFLVRMTMSRLQAEVGNVHLVRIHRSKMVAHRDIVGLRHAAKGTWRVLHRDGSESAIGRTFLEPLKMVLGIGGDSILSATE